jgi:hypothetical protein
MAGNFGLIQINMSMPDCGMIISIIEIKETRP